MNEKLNKMIKKDKILLIVGIGFLIALLACIYWAYDITKKDVPQIMEVDKVDEGAYLNTVIVPYGFAVNQDETSWLAIVMDENNYLYIVQLSESQYDVIENYFDSDEEKVYRIEGTTKEIDSSIASLAMDAYNEGAEDDDLITEDNFNEYFGYFYLQIGDAKDISLPVVLGTISLILSLSFGIVGLKAMNKTKKTVESEEYQKAIEEINNPEYENKNAILTKNYIIYSGSGLNIVDYKDVTWVYRHTFRYNGVPNHSLAYYIRGSKKMHLIAFGLSQKSVDEMVEYIGKKNKDVLVGYTKENISKHKEMI